MKYLLTLLIVGALACSKDADNKQSVSEPTAKFIEVKTINSSPSVPNAYWTFDLTIPDTNTVSKLYFKRVSPSQVIFLIDKPKTKSYTLIQPGVAAPNGSPQAYFFFEWLMTDGSIKKGDPFEVVE